MKTIFITGASSGLGKAAAKLFQNRGWNVIATPNQIIATERNAEYSGFSIFVHPDFFRNYPQGKNLKKYGFFSYATNEALHLSEAEQIVILNLFKSIDQELNIPIDETSQDVLISYIEVLLNYSQRFYKRQFMTRKAVNHDLLVRMEELLDEYFDNGFSLEKGLPTVEYLADQVNLSPLDFRSNFN